MVVSKSNAFSCAAPAWASAPLCLRRGLVCSQKQRRFVAHPLFVGGGGSSETWSRRGLGCSQKQRRFVAPPLCVGDGGSSESWSWGAPGAASRAAAFGSASPACANAAVLFKRDLGCNQKQSSAKPPLWTRRTEEGGEDKTEAPGELGTERVGHQVSSAPGG